MSDLIVSFLSSVPAEVLAKFATPPLTLAVPAAPLGHGMEFYASWLSKVRDGKGNVVPGMYAMAGGKGSIGRVAVIGFSNGVGSGVGQVLQANDASKIDFIGAFDGIHGSFSGGTTLLPSTYTQWIGYAMLAAASRPSMNPRGQQMVITHSSIEPDFPSTTETAALIWSEVLKRAPADYESTYWDELDKLVYPGGFTLKSADTSGKGGVMPTWTWQSFSDGWYDRRVANGLSVFGWGDPGWSPHKRFQARTRDQFNGTADHLFQARAVLPAILTTYLAGRWNPTCGPLTGLGSPEGCASGDGQKYDDAPDQSLPNPYPVGVSVPTQPATCPYPPPGQVVVGDPKDPCHTSDKPGSLIPQAKPPVGSTTGGKLIAGLAGAALGYMGARALMARRRA